MLEVERIFDLARRSWKAHHEAPIADFDVNCAGFRAGRRDLGFVVRATVNYERAIECLAPILAPPRDQQVLEEFVEGASEILDPEWIAALWRS
jgi:hypothetical protein